MTSKWHCVIVQHNVDRHTFSVHCWLVENADQYANYRLWTSVYTLSKTLLLQAIPVCIFRCFVALYNCLLAKRWSKGTFVGITLSFWLFPMKFKMQIYLSLIICYLIWIDIDFYANDCPECKQIFIDITAIMCAMQYSVLFCCSDNNHNC